MLLCKQLSWADVNERKLFLFRIIRIKHDGVLAVLYRDCRELQAYDAARVRCNLTVHVQHFSSAYTLLETWQHRPQTHCSEPL